MTLPLSLAYAGQSTDSSDILNGQVDFHVDHTNLNLDVTDAAGNVSGTSVAGGNAVDITTMNNTNVTNNQYVSSVSVSSDLNANVANTGGTVDLQSQAVCNSAGVSTDPAYTNVYSQQECDAQDPSASLNANLQNIGNDVSLASTAVGNSFEEDTNAKYSNIQNYQINNSNINATTNANIVNVNGNVDASATAIGNTAQIIHY
jgi:hypothetical protein